MSDDVKLAELIAEDAKLENWFAHGTTPTGGCDFWRPVRVVGGRVEGKTANFGDKLTLDASEYLTIREHPLRKAGFWNFVPPSAPVSDIRLAESNPTLAGHTIADLRRQLAQRDAENAGLKDRVKEQSTELEAYAIKLQNTRAVADTVERVTAENAALTERAERAEAACVSLPAEAANAIRTVADKWAANPNDAMTHHPRGRCSTLLMNVANEVGAALQHRPNPGQSLLDELASLRERCKGLEEIVGKMLDILIWATGSMTWHVDYITRAAEWQDVIREGLATTTGEAAPQAKEHQHQFDSDGGTCNCGKSVADLLDDAQAAEREGKA